MSQLTIDLNADCGESYGPWTLGDDAALLRAVTSANVACGGHAGDPLTMRRTVELARDLGVQVGAHPGYPDLQGFGRRPMFFSSEEIKYFVLAQIGALYAIARSEGVELTHVKPHGALANKAAVEIIVANAIVRASASFSRQLPFVALAGSALETAAREAGLPVIREAYADRVYHADGTLLPRQMSGAVIHDKEQSLAQVLSIVRQGQAFTSDGTAVPIQADTICLHGDTPGAVSQATFIRRELEREGVVVRPFRVTR